MKAKKAIPLIIIITGAVLLAFVLRGTVVAGIILPLARLAWLIKGYYGAFPQAAYWGLALGAGILLVVIRVRLPERKKHYKISNKPLPGPLVELSFWIQRMKSGVYPKWHVARLLADLALDLLNQHGVREKNILRHRHPGWTPPEEVERYLDAALNTNYTDYPRPKRFRPKLPNPFDQDIEPVISYLESVLESEK